MSKMILLDRIESGDPPLEENTKYPLDPASNVYGHSMLNTPVLV